MNLGDGLLFELENGKPKLILLNRGEKVPKNAVKPRLPSVLSCRQPSRLETHTARTEAQPIRKQNALNGRRHQGKPGSEGATVGGRGQTVTTSKTQENHVPGKEVKIKAKVKATKPQNVKPSRKPEEPKRKAEQSAELSNHSTTLQDSESCLTNEQLQHMLNAVQTNDYHLNNEEIQAHVTESVSSETKEPEEMREETGTGNAQNKDKRSGGLLRWVEERPSEDRAALEAKKAQWKKELDEQVALKQKIHRSAPPRLQEDDMESLVSVQSSVSYKDLPAAIRSSLRVGEFAPMDELELMQEQKQEQRRRWLQELDKQREETSERKRLEKLQQRQTEDQHLWASHFDSLQRPPLPPPHAPPHAPALCPRSPSLCSSADRGETGLCSRLSQWDEASVRASVETSSSSGGHSTRASHLRTMTALLDPAEIEARERRRLKQLEQQRAIELQMEERRRRKEEEESLRKQEEEEEERRLEQERERLQRQYERERQRNKEPSPEPSIPNCSEPEPQSNTAASLDESPALEAGPTAVNPHRDTGVQTEEVHISESSEPDSALVPGAKVVDRAQVLHMLQMLHKGFSSDVYEPFARTERSRKDEKRPEWNTQRPSRRFVPASQRYPKELQRQRQESRLRRQAQLLSLHRNPNNNPTTGPNLCPTSEPEQNGPETHRVTGRVETCGQTTDRGRSPVHSESPAPDFLPYVRTDEVFNLKSVETQLQPQHTVHTAPAPQLLQKTQRQQEIIRGLAQLRQGLLQKQRELESDLSHGRLDNDLRPVSTTAATYRRER